METNHEIWEGVEEVLLLHQIEEQLKLIIPDFNVFIFKEDHSYYNFDPSDVWVTETEIYVIRIYSQLKVFTFKGNSNLEVTYQRLLIDPEFLELCQQNKIS